MSTFSLAYDAIISRIQTVLPTYQRVTNPYNLDQNSEKELILGYGLAVGGCQNTRREIGCGRFFIEREMQIIITSQQFKKQLDVTGRSSVEKAIVDAFVSLVNSFESFRDLGLQEVVDFDYQSDGGIEFVFAQKDNYLALRGIFSLEYYENIS